MIRRDLIIVGMHGVQLPECIKAEDALQEMSARLKICLREGLLVSFSLVLIPTTKLACGPVDIKLSGPWSSGTHPGCRYINCHDIMYVLFF